MSFRWPFRWTELWGRGPEVVAMLEERDRALEDHLQGLGGVRAAGVTGAGYGVSWWDPTDPPAVPDALGWGPPFGDRLVDTEAGLADEQGGAVLRAQVAGTYLWTLSVDASAHLDPSVPIGHAQVALTYLSRYAEDPAGAAAARFAVWNDALGPAHTATVAALVDLADSEPFYVSFAPTPDWPAEFTPDAEVIDVARSHMTFTLIRAWPVPVTYVYPT